MNHFLGSLPESGKHDPIGAWQRQFLRERKAKGIVPSPGYGELWRPHHDKTQQWCGDCSWGVSQGHNVTRQMALSVCVWQEDGRLEFWKGLVLRPSYAYGRWGKCVNRDVHILGDTVGETVDGPQESGPRWSHSNQSRTIRNGTG